MEKTISIIQDANSGITAIATISSRTKHYKIIGNTILFDYKDATVYNLLGVRLSSKGETSVSLPAGIYFVQTANGTDKFVIR